MTWDDFVDAVVFTWAIVVGFAMGATLALQFGNWWLMRIMMGGK